jgi:2-oxoglutarate dehydrogenase E2 component (dihydrolipoamide succinyltransferase)
MSSMVEVRAPKDQSEGTRSQLQRWLKSVGESVTENEPLIEVETDKVTIEIPAPASGVLREVLKQPQEEIEPGELLAWVQVGAESEQAPTAAPAKGATVKADPGEMATRTSALRAHADIMSLGRSSPAVRRLLQEHGLDAATIAGTGLGGRITVEDVLAHAHGSQASKPAAEAEPGVEGTFRREPHSATRKRIAERMVESLLHTAPHVTTVFEVDLGDVLEHRARHRDDFQARGASLTLTSYFVAACVDAIRAVPEANSRWTADALLIHETIDIGVGTAVEGQGLVVPVLRDVQSMSLFEISLALSELVQKARERRLQPADVRPGTFTISNHGVSGSLIATPIIINQPQSAILGVGKMEKRAVVVTEAGQDRIEIRPRCFVTLTLDHRVMDGHRANRFLTVLTERLERWSD